MLGTFADKGTRPPGREGFGFTSMRERAKKLNWILEIRAAPGGGTSIVVSLPTV
jgi:signal transduction histidine kinase